jgi:L-lactate dehydrogenase complex protein LldG
MTDAVDSFRSSLTGTATLHETTPGETAETIEDALEEPAVGVPVHIEGVSLPETVETEFSPSELSAARTGVTTARHAIADYGTVTLASNPEGGELVSLYPPRHVAVVAASDLHANMTTAHDRFARELTGGGESGTDSQVLATGPSATADMGTLVEGVHGPHEVHVVLVADEEGSE